jgi:hypothetical protein
MTMTDEHWLPYESEADKLPLDTGCGDELERADSDDQDHHVTVWGSISGTVGLGLLRSRARVCRTATNRTAVVRLNCETDETGGR